MPYGPLGWMANLVKSVQGVTGGLFDGHEDRGTTLVNKEELYNKNNYTLVTLAPLSGRTYTTLATVKFPADGATRH